MPRRAKPAEATSALGPTKQEFVIQLLRRDDGATIAEITAATGWKPHSARAFLTAVIKKRLGLALASDKNDGQRRYRIAS